jgi:hypothetical protein
MNEQNNKDQPQSRVKRGSNTFSYLAVVVVVLLVIIFYFYLQKSPSPSSSPVNQVENGATVQQADTQSPGLVTEMAIEREEDLPSSDVNGLENKQPINPAEKKGANADTPALPAAEDMSEQTQQRLSPGSNHQQLIDEINSFYVHLDQQPYMQSFDLKESSKIHFSKLLQKLVDNPPVVLRETDDLFTLLQNTAHFFRILGKDNINILKAILSNEKNSFEQILESFYSLTYQPKYLKKEYSLSIAPDALTDYAGFFLNTMGGRLYLFRRDSISRMVVSYYAIITIDRANRDGNGGHGIDLRTAILSLTDEIENGGNRLQLKEKYLDTLYDLQEKYN